MVFGLEKFIYPEEVPSPRPRINRRREEPVDESRRKFLKFLGGAAAAGVVANPVIKAAEKAFDQLGRIGSVAKEGESGNGPDEERAEATTGQVEIANHDAKSLEEIVSYRKPGKINLNLDTAKQVENYWLNQYAVGDLHRSLETAYRDIGEWQPYLEAEFRKEFNQNFARAYGQDAQERAISLVYLAIPESHWNVKAISPAKAVGPYQFMQTTAKQVDLRVGAGIDERKDPVKSARACAKVLKQLYQATQDWDLTLSGYNGGFVWRYLKEARSGGREIGYANFLEYLQGKINQAKADVEKNGKIGPDRKEAEFRRRTAGFAENINYPAKFNAVYALIKEKLVNEQKPAVVFEEKRVSNPALVHRVKKGDSLSLLARRYGLTEDQLCRYNGLGRNKPIKMNALLKIPPRLNLAEIGRQRQIPVSRLAHLNPAMEVDTPIPHNYVVRV